jgi:hypothetical protein
MIKCNHHATAASQRRLASRGNAHFSGLMQCGILKFTRHAGRNFKCYGADLAGLTMVFFSTSNTDAVS